MAQPTPLSMDEPEEHDYPADGDDLSLADNARVAADRKKIAGGKRLSPVLMVRGHGEIPLLVADGYHRVCASDHLDENTDIACRIVDPLVSARSPAARP